MAKAVKKVIKKVVDIFDAPEPPKVLQEEEPTAPDPDNEAAARAKSRQLQRRKRTGRTSTVMSEGNQLG